MIDEWSGGESLEDVAGELDSLIQILDSHPDADVQRLALRLLDRVDVLHRLGLTGIIEELREANATEIMQHALDRPPVRLLLQLYDLLPGEDSGPIEIALDQVRQELTANGATVALVGVTDGVPRLRLSGTDPKSIDGMREVVAAVLREQFPALQTVRFEDHKSALADELLPLMVVERRPQQARSWFPVTAADEIPAGTIVAATVAGRRLALWRDGFDVVAVRDVCPGSALPIAAASLAGREVLCPWHACRFDARTGRRVDAIGEGLEVFTVAVHAGVVEVELAGELVAEVAAAR